MPVLTDDALNKIKTSLEEPLVKHPHGFPVRLVRDLIETIIFTKKEKKKWQNVAAKRGESLNKILKISGEVLENTETKKGGMIPLFFGDSMYKEADLNAYQSMANEVAIYPGRFGNYTEKDAHQSSPFIGFFYVCLGLSGEIGELQEKIICQEPVEDIIKEMGDVYWYISQVCMELGAPMSYLLKVKVQYKNLRKIQNILPVTESQLLSLSIISGRICEITKKLLRDGNGHMPSAKREQIIENLAKIVHIMNGICGTQGISYEEVMKSNIDKLFSRRDRGVLGGSGDNR